MQVLAVNRTTIGLARGWNLNVSPIEGDKTECMTDGVLHMVISTVKSMDNCQVGVKEKYRNEIKQSVSRRKWLGLASHLRGMEKN